MADLQQYTFNRKVFAIRKSCVKGVLKGDARHQVHPRERRFIISPKGSQRDATLLYNIQSRLNLEKHLTDLRFVIAAWI